MNQILKAENRKKFKFKKAKKMPASFYLIIIDINENVKLPLKPNYYNKKPI
jgi:hypothetical protein